MKTYIMIFITYILISSNVYASDCSKEDAVNALALNSYHESRGEGVEGILAVMWVVINRYNDYKGRFGSTLCDIVYAPSTTGVEDQCQFSWTCGNLDHDPIDTKAYEAILIRARDMINGVYHFDPTFGSLYYYRCEIDGTRGWMNNLEFMVKVKDHCFYTDKEK